MNYLIVIVVYFTGRSEKFLQEIEKCELSFVSTKGSQHAEQILNKKRCLTITGPQGCGKKSIAHHVAFKYSKKDYEVLFIKNVTEFLQCFHTDKRQLFVIDDPFGSPALDESKLSDWYHEDISLCLENSSTLKILFTSRSLVLQNRICQSIFGLLSENVLDIASPKNRLDKEEIDSFLKSVQVPRNKRVI